MDCLCITFHMLSDRQFQYTLVLMYISVKTHNVHRTRNVRFFTFVFSVKGMIAVILILVVAVYQQILSSTEQGFIGLLRGNQTSISCFSTRDFKVGHYGRLGRLDRSRHAKHA